jgi:hypothetical protein
MERLRKKNAKIRACFLRAWRYRFFLLFSSRSSYLLLIFASAIMRKRGNRLSEQMSNYGKHLEIYKKIQLSTEGEWWETKERPKEMEDRRA